MQEWKDKNITAMGKYTEGIKSILKNILEKEEENWKMILK